VRFRVPKAFVPRFARLLPPSVFLRLAHGVNPAVLPRPDLIVSAGGATVGANVALARTLGARNVFCGSMRGLGHARFSLVLTPYESAARAANVAVVPKPSPFDPDNIPPPKPVRAASDLFDARASLLVGGPTAQVPFDTRDWAALANLIRGAVARWHLRLTVVTSPRTPAAAYAAIESALGDLDPAVSLIDYRREGAGSIEKAFDTDLILVTADSMSMMTEAALSRRPALALAPRVVRHHRDDEAVQALEIAGRIRLITLSDTTVEAVAAAIPELQPMTENHLDRLAAIILKGTGLDKAGDG
jgi:mitochondrial fission protein ELM1